MSEQVRTIEVEGHKFEVDLRTAKKVESFKVGDRVKVLTKNYSGYESHVGAIVGIDAFKSLPTIVVAYIENPLCKTGEIKFAYLNSQSKDVEICPMSEDDLIPTRDTILTYFERSIDELRRKMEEIAAKRDYFLRQYGVSFAAGAEEVAAAVAPPSDPFGDDLPL